eukprot:g9453.t1 g9453   contig36:616284-616849(-)
MEQRISIVRHHFTQKGYRVHSGLQFGCELVLYADSPGRVHSDFCVHVVGVDGRLDWRTLQTLVRAMPDLHKTLIVANVRQVVVAEDESNDSPGSTIDYSKYAVDELAMGTEHAPFRHKNIPKGVGTQTKPVPKSKKQKL